MPDTMPSDLDQIREANRRYWSSDASVNQIADDLGLSKSSLYGMIDQLPTGLACPACGAELVYPNRTARDRGMVACPECGFEGEEDGLEEASPVRTATHEPGAGRPAASGRTVAGAALLGLAAGIVIGSLARR